jgi:uncharacterized membrane protein
LRLSPLFRPGDFCDNRRGARAAARNEGSSDEGAGMRRPWPQNRWPTRLRHLTRAEVEHIVFWAGILLKAADAVLEVLGAIALIFISAQTINQVVRGLVRPELAEDPGDVIAGLILKYIGHVSSASKLFAIFYLLIHGVAKLFIVGALWVGRLWAYPLAGLVFAGFIVYQMVIFAHTYSPWMIALTVLDVVIIALLPPEYRRAKLAVRRRRDKRP